MSEEGTILLVEDDANDAYIARKALSKASLTNPIIRLRDGEEAMHYLAGEPPFHDRKNFPLPVLVLLDLKMPKYNGFDVLKWLQSRPELAKVPVVVLTGSVYEEDRERAKQFGAAGYEVKPADASEVAAVARTVRIHLSS